MSDSLKLPNGLQAHLGVANLRNQSCGITQTMVLLPEQTASDLLPHESQRRARFFQIFARFVHRRVMRLLRAGGDGGCALDLFAANPAKIFAERFALPQFVAHIDLFARQSHVAVAFLAGDFPPKPARRLEFPAARLAWEFDFRYDQTMVAAAINVDLDLEIFPRNFVTGFA